MEKEPARNPELDPREQKRQEIEALAQAGIRLQALRGIAVKNELVAHQIIEKTLHRIIAEFELTPIQINENGNWSADVIINSEKYSISGTTDVLPPVEEDR